MHLFRYYTVCRALCSIDVPPPNRVFEDMNVTSLSLFISLSLFLPVSKVAVDTQLI